ncbi:uncharacterized protein LOC109706358 [Ananas comosus]|uniref:E3 ubiquitin-protein ligase RMA n=1 Tax=Ananas comosus TaxID=4615 RepID=A0A6P5EN48_ANACO|nr:uncharacterized protein LOC109706358 [Ananas comosus]XP_020082740.1 uncharacterized protein LOC109706358 [Ananas comosus]
MANEIGENGNNIVDLNLYLANPTLPRRISRDLGSDLALGSLMLPSLFSEEAREPTSNSIALRPSILDAPYSPSNSLFAPDQLPADPTAVFEDNSNLSSHDPNGSSFDAGRESVLQIDSSFPPPPPPPPPLPPPTPPLVVGVRPTVVEMPFDPTTPLGGVADEPIAPSGNPPLPFLPSCPPTSRIPQLDDASSSIGPILLIPVTDLVGPGDRASSIQQLQEYPQLRFQRLIEVRHRLGVRRVGPSSDPPHDSDQRFESGAHSLTSPERLMHDIVQSQRTLESLKKRKLGAEGKEAADTDKNKEEECECGANFECNICFEVAKEPVVTPCGHLFCWPCLYQWLHAHSEHSECPVCKGEVLEVNVTPIYGRGGSDAGVEKKCEESWGSGIKIPPRPHAHRIESLRQHLQRPVSRRLAESTTISWRRIIDDEMQIGAHLEGRSRSPRVLGRFDAVHPSVLTRLRPRRTQREEGGSNSVSPPNNSSGHANGGGSGQAEAILPSATMYSNNNNNNNTGMFRRLPSPYIYQPSTSSTMAFIEGNVASTDDSTERTGEGSSRFVRSRGGNSPSVPLDVDDAELHTRRRRRLY